jgi:hypothetical protein
MSKVSDLMTEVAALKAQLEEMKSQPVPTVTVYVDRVVEKTVGKMSRRQEIIGLLCTAESVHKKSLVKETGMSDKNVDSYVCYLRREGWHIINDNSRYSLGDCSNFRQLASMPNAPDWMRMRLELIVAKEEIEAEIRAKYNK